jgi:EmrB/QacA subfamily drug resistance transporter
MVTLDITIVNVALPSVQHDLHAPVSGLQWIVDAYTLVLGSLLMLSGSTGDRIGRRRMFTIGLVLFSLGSLLCSLAPDLTLLVVFRMVQAIGGSMLTPIAMSIITNTFTRPKERAQAIGVWGAVTGVSLALGPVVGGLLVTSIGWRSIFWVNVPVGVVATVLTLRYVPESRAPRPRKLDLAGQFLVIALLASLTYGIIEAPTRGLGSPEIVSMFAVSVASLVGLALYEPRRVDPLIELRFFRSVPFASATVIAVAVFAGMGGFLFMNTLYLQETRGLSALHAGLDTIPAAAMTIVLSPVSGWLVGRRGSRLPIVLSGAALLVAGALLAQITRDTSYVWLFAAYVVFGTGYGVANAPITNNAVSGMPRAQAGVAAAIASTARQVGQTLGVAVTGALVTAGTAGHALATRLPAATHPAWWVLAGGGALVIAIGYVSTTPWSTGTALRTARELNPEGVDAAGLTGGATHLDRATARSRRQRG